MTDLEQLFQDSVALAEQGQPPPGDPLGRLGRARAARRRRRWLVAVPTAAAAVAAAAILAAVLPRDDGGLVAAGEGASPEPSPAGTACVYRPSPQDAVGPAVGPPPAEARDLPSGATIHTSRGDITVDFTARQALTPCTINSFAHLATTRFYDGSPCHRLTTQGIFVLQCGDPSGTGSGGPGYAYDEEHLAGSTYPAGTLAMANAGPGTTGSQLFLVYRDTELDPNYTVFGRVTEGLDVVEAVAAAGAQPAGDGQPKLAVSIKSVELAS